MALITKATSQLDREFGVLFAMCTSHSKLESKSTLREKKSSSSVLRSLVKPKKVFAPNTQRRFALELLPQRFAAAIKQLWNVVGGNGKHRFCSSLLRSHKTMTIIHGVENRYPNNSNNVCVCVLGGLPSALTRRICFENTLVRLLCISDHEIDPRTHTHTLPSG